MRFILDANIPYSAKDVFHHSDHAVHVRDIGFSDASDSEILEYALRKKAVVVTKDLDFANSILHPITTHHGVLVLRLPSHFPAVAIKAVLKEFLATIEKKDLEHSITIVEPGRYRIRRHFPDKN